MAIQSLNSITIGLEKRPVRMVTQIHNECQRKKLETLETLKRGIIESPSSLQLLVAMTNELHSY